MPTISTVPVFAIASMRLRPIQPTPRNPTRGSFFSGSSTGVKVAEPTRGSSTVALPLELPNVRPSPPGLVLPKPKCRVREKIFIMSRVPS